MNSYTVYFYSGKYYTIFQHAVDQGFKTFAKYIQKITTRILFEIDPLCVEQFKMACSGCTSLLGLAIESLNLDMFKMLIDYGCPMIMTQEHVDFYNKW